MTATSPVTKETLAQLPKDVRGPVAKHKVIALLFYNNRSADDRAVRRALSHVSTYGGQVFVDAHWIKNVARYQAITRGVDVEQSPTIVIADRNLKAETLVGYADEHDDRPEGRGRDPRQRRHARGPRRRTRAPRRPSKPGTIVQKAVGDTNTAAAQEKVAAGEAPGGLAARRGPPASAPTRRRRRSLPDRALQPAPLHEAGARRAARGRTRRGQRSARSSYCSSTTTGPTDDKAVRRALAERRSLRRPGLRRRSLDQERRAATRPSRAAPTSSSRPRSWSPTATSRPRRSSASPTTETIEQNVVDALLASGGSTDQGSLRPPGRGRLPTAEQQFSGARPAGFGRGRARLPRGRDAGQRRSTPRSVVNQAAQAAQELTRMRSSARRGNASGIALLSTSRGRRRRTLPRQAFQRSATAKTSASRSSSSRGTAGTASAASRPPA